jgi:GMP synthase (glutamine-hydrolysing)
LGDITPEKVSILQDVDAVLSIKILGLYDKVWQAGAILLPVNSVGWVMSVLMKSSRTACC